MILSNAFVVRPILVTIIALFTLGVPPEAAAQGAKQSRECTIEDVAIYEDRVVIQCDVKGGKMSPAKYYAVAVASPLAPLVLELGLASLKRKVKVYFSSDASLNPPGCLPTDCRKLQGIIALSR